MSDTPRCPRCQAPSFLAGINTRIFECESDGKTPSTACKYASQLQERIKRLEEAGNKLTPGAAAVLMWSEIEEWTAAKEAKP